jgi:transcriptional regulator with XRE-family HTH domain
MTPGEMIRDFREQRGMTPEELALAAGMRPQYLLQIESGEIHRVHTFTYQKLADALHVTLGMVLGQELSPPAGHTVFQELPSSYRFVVRATIHMCLLFGSLLLLGGLLLTGCELTDILIRLSLHH